VSRVPGRAFPSLFPSIRIPFRWLSLAAVLIMLAAPAWAANDEVQFGSSIKVPKGQSIHDAVCFFCSVQVDGELTGDIVSFFGDVRVNGTANHDVVNFFGTVTVADGASIRHDVVNFFGGLRLGDDASVGKDAVVMFGQLRQADSANIGGNRVVRPGWIFWMPLLLVSLGVSFVVQEARMARRRMILGGY
jgi:hypothetical protein